MMLQILPDEEQAMTAKRKRTIEPQFFQRLLLITLVAQYIWFLVGQLIFFPTVSPWKADQFILFTALFAVHFALHCFARVLCGHPIRATVYAIVQSCMIFAISVVGNSGEFRQWLFLPIFGELILYANSLWLAAFTTAIMFGFSIVQGYVAFGEGLLDRVILNVVWWSLWWGLAQSPYVSVLLMQVWGRRRAVSLLSELDVAHRQLAEYAIQVEKLTLNNERARMARELHDTLAQGLTGTILQLEALEAYLEIGDHTKAGNIATQTKKRARAALADSRRAIDDLRLQPLDYMELPELIQHEIERFSEATGISYSLDMLPTLDVTPPATAEHLLRCISEALSNIARHAKASHVWLSLHQKGDTLHVTISDNGIGFDVESAASLTGHYGLMGIRERARLIGATPVIESAPDAGTTISINMKNLRTA